MKQTNNQLATKWVFKYVCCKTIINGSQQHSFSQLTSEERMHLNRQKLLTLIYDLNA